MFGECYYSSPFHVWDTVVEGSTNVCQRRIFQAGVQQGDSQDYWNNRNAVSPYQGSTDGTNYDQQTNQRSLKTIFNNCINQDMTDPDNVARFLLEVLMQTRCFKININCLSGDSFQSSCIYWVPYVPAVGANVGLINGTPSTLTPSHQL